MVKITKPQLKNLDGIEIFDAREYFKAQNICSTLSNSTLSSSTLSRPRCIFKRDLLKNTKNIVFQ